jgi:hypothetical protein
VKDFFGWEPHLVRDGTYLIALAVILFALLHNATQGYAHGGEILLAAIIGLVSRHVWFHYHHHPSKPQPVTRYTNPRYTKH